MSPFIIHLSCGAGARGVPAMTGARGVPAMPGARGVPAMPGARGVPAMPGARGVPAMPGARGVPALAEPTRKTRVLDSQDAPRESDNSPVFLARTCFPDPGSMDMTSIFGASGATKGFVEAALGEG